ncbi:MAG: transcription elongation factor GreA [Oscillospiraceae bacterium]|jgi:transcription elongation factor GreA|nr:transcription elongation factor GreA [Oscillospiraceae bacterium]
MNTEILMTVESYDDMKKELDWLRATRRREIAEKIRVARGFGDLSENSEYDEAKNDQAILEARIAQMEEQLKKAKLLQKEQLSTDSVSVGTLVTIFDMDYDEETTYRIASAVESGRSALESITDESPVGKALLGHKKGDVVEVLVPNGMILKFKILDISIS